VTSPWPHATAFTRERFVAEARELLSSLDGAETLFEARRALFDRVNHLQFELSARAALLSQT